MTEITQEARRTIRERVLDRAKTCVMGKREQDYGSPEDNFGMIAELWTVYLGSEVIRITPGDVAMMMALLKIARIRNGGGTGDSFVDLAGYAACGAEVSEKGFESAAKKKTDCSCTKKAAADGGMA